MGGSVVRSAFRRELDSGRVGLGRVEHHQESEEGTERKEQREV